jgi:lipid II:glycine glycyltransferase (peptidoglycan interpeptide bridge formation enzyme)
MSVDATAPATATACRGLRVERLERGRYVALASEFADHNYRQTWEFGRLAAERGGATFQAVAVRDGAGTIAVALVRIRRLPFLGGIAYVSGGPLTRTDAAFDATTLVDAVAALREEYVESRGLVLRVAPPVGPAAWNRDAETALARAGFVRARAAAAYRTMIVPLTRSVGEVRRRLRPKWRNCLNRAERQGLVVRAASGPEALDSFIALYEEFAARKGFDANLGPDFFARVQRGLPDVERMLVLTAERDGTTIAGHVSSALGDTVVYLLGATSPEALTCNAAYLLHWRAIETAVERGRRWYDLGGVDPERNAGVFHFKQGFGGDDVVAAGPLEFRPGGAGARLVLAMESGYRSLRR